MPISFREAQRWGFAQLMDYSDTPQVDVAVLLAFVAHVQRTELYVRAYEILDTKMYAAFQALIHRRQTGEPVAYLINEREFYGLRFFVDERVLIPRPDTELLIERALDWLKQQEEVVRIVDVGTGSGCLAVTLAILAPGHEIIALDVSHDALDVASMNVQRHQVTDQIRLVQSDGLNAIQGPVQLVVSNPPYTILSEIDQNVYDFEPHLALDGGRQGLEIYEAWLGVFATKLDRSRQSAVMLEIGSWQADAVQALAAKVWPQAAITLWQDLGQRDRVVDIRIPAQK